MNEMNVNAWVEERLLPAFESVHPEKRMILVMDNAPYHTIRNENYIDQLRLKRSELFSELILTANVNSLKVK